MRSDVPGMRADSPQSHTGTRAASQTCHTCFSRDISDARAWWAGQGRADLADKSLLPGEKGGSDFWMGLSRDLRTSLPFPRGKSPARQTLVKILLCLPSSCSFPAWWVRGGGWKARSSWAQVPLHSQVLLQHSSTIWDGSEPCPLLQPLGMLHGMPWVSRESSAGLGAELGVKIKPSLCSSGPASLPAEVAISAAVTSGALQPAQPALVQSPFGEEGAHFPFLI